jgi:hypothetical protein
MSETAHVQAGTEQARYARAQESDERHAQRRMTPEEVAAAREASRKQYSRVIRDGGDEKYDTAMLDISKIVGFKGELSKTFEMVDQLSDSESGASGDRKGGTRS